MAIVYLIVALLISVAAVVFALQNSMEVMVTLAVWKFEGSLSLILLLSFFIGIFIGIFIMLPGNLRKTFELSGLKKRIHKKDKTAEEPAQSEPVPEIKVEKQKEKPSR